MSAKWSFAIVQRMRKYLFSIVDGDDVQFTTELNAEQALDIMLNSDIRVTRAAPQPIYALREDKPVEKTVNKRPRRTREGVMACCGSNGTRHLNTCQDNSEGDAPVAAISTDSKKLSREQFDQIREAVGGQRESLNASKYGLVNKMSPLEVKRAAKSATYEDYVDIQ